MSSDTSSNGRKPPMDNMLRSIVVFFLSNIQGEHNVLRVESWLRYGEEATPNPFGAVVEDDHSALRPVAYQVIAAAAKKKQLTIAQYDLKAVLVDTLAMFDEYGVDAHTAMQEPIIDLVQHYISIHPAQK